MDENTNSEYNQFDEEIIEWSANPTDQRSAREVAELLGCDQTTVYRHRKSLEDAISKRFEAKRKSYLGSMRTRAYKSLSNRLLKSDKSLDLFFKLVGDLVERSETKIEYHTPEEKRTKIKELLDKVSSRLDDKKEG